MSANAVNPSPNYACALSDNEGILSVTYTRDRELTVFVVNFGHLSNIPWYSQQFFYDIHLRIFKSKKTGEYIFSVLLLEPEKIKRVVERMKKAGEIPEAFASQVLTDIK